MKKLLIALILTLTILLSACADPTYAGYKYDDFEVIREWDTLEDVGQDGYEMIYLYDMDFLGRDTQGSSIINPDLFTFAKEHDNALTMWRLNTREISGQSPIEFQRRAPKIVFFRDGEFQDKYFGGTPILEMIEGLENDRFHLPELRGRIDPLEETFNGNDFSDFPVLDRWYDIHNLGYDDVDVVFVYQRDEEGLSETSEALMGDVLQMNDALGEDQALYTANIHETIGLYAHDMETPQAPSMYIVYNNVIQDSVHGEDAVRDFVENPGAIDFDAYKE